MATEEEGEPFEIGVTLAGVHQAGILPRWTSRQNTTLRHGAITPAGLWRKRGNIPNGSVPPEGSKSNKRWVVSFALEAKVIRLRNRWQVSGRSTDSPGLLIVKINRQVSLTNRLALQSNTHTNKWGQRRTRTEHRWLKIKGDHSVNKMLFIIHSREKCSKQYVRTVRTHKHSNTWHGFNLHHKDIFFNAIVEFMDKCSSRN